MAAASTDFFAIGPTIRSLRAEIEAATGGGCVRFGRAGARAAVWRRDSLSARLAGRLGRGCSSSSPGRC
ncbi:hypothetical protein [Methylobacterium gregans]|uniref:hypothetical protein n=1 Tax=Methylobacterium gregans TaxID=374424 RepID=UPI00361C266E